MIGGYSIDYWPGTKLIKSAIPVDDESDVPEGCTYWAPSDGPLPPTDLSPEAAEAAEYSKLQSKQRQANEQVAALQGRIDTINDAIEYDEALPEEVAELPTRTAQLKVWKKYRIDLGRVTGIDGWYQNPTYPEVPDLYVSEVASASA